MKPVPQAHVLVMITLFMVLGFFAGQNHAGRYDEKDLNKDGAVTFADFSIALHLVDEIMTEL